MTRKSFAITIHVTDETGEAACGLAGLDEKTLSEYVGDLVTLHVHEKTVYAQRLSRILLERKEPAERRLLDK